MAKKQSQRWKDLERRAAKLLNGDRILRGHDFSNDAPDVDVPDFPELKVDAKAHNRFAHHSLIEEIKHKYCGPTDIPVLVTKHARQNGEYVTIPLTHYATLLNAVRALRKAYRRARKQT